MARPYQIADLEGRLVNLAEMNLEHFKDGVKFINAERAYLFSGYNRFRLNGNEKIPGLQNIMKLVSLQPLLDNTHERMLGSDKKARNVMFVDLFEKIMADGDEAVKDEMQAFMKGHYGLFREEIYCRKSLHQWLCDNNYVTAKTYEKILNSVEPEDRDIIVAWGNSHDISGKIEKSREAMLNRKELPLSEWRKRWDLTYIREFKDNKIRAYSLSNWHLGNNDMVIIPDHIGSIPVESCHIEHLQCKEMVLLGNVKLTYENVKLEVFHNRSSIYYGLDRQSEGYPECAVIPEDKTEIADGAFRFDPTVKMIEGLDHVKKIGAEAFSGCASLKGPLEIPESVEWIGGGAFALTGIDSFKVHSGLKFCGRKALASKPGVRIFCSPETVGVICGIEEEDA